MTDPAGVGFVGLGRMGSPMATRLTDWPGGLKVFDPELGGAPGLISRGATMAVSPSHVAELASVVCVMVRGDEEVRGVVAEILTTARPGTIVLLHSTVRPETAAELAREGDDRGVHVLDAAPSGGPGGAEQGRLAFMVGGSPEGFKAALPVLQRMGDLVIRVGDAGAGNRARLARNLVLFASLAAAGEAARLAEAAGIDPTVLGKIVRHSDEVTGGPGAQLLRDTAGPVSADDPWFPVLDRISRLGEEDLRLSLDLAAELGVEAPIAEVAARSLRSSLGLPEDADE